MHGLKKSAAALDTPPLCVKTGGNSNWGSYGSIGSFFTVKWKASVSYWHKIKTVKQWYVSEYEFL